MRSVFVTGTDTGVGKTVVAGALARAAAMAGCRTAVYKPFMAGGSDDTAALGAALAGVQGPAGDGREGRAGWEVRSEYKFDTPASPYTAARLEGKAVDAGAVLDRFAQLRQEYEAVVVEGIGGAMTPIRRDYFVADLARDMAVPSIIVASNGFDSGGHAAMAASHCERLGAHVAGFVVNRIHEYGYPRGALCSEITDVTGLPVLATVRRRARGMRREGGTAAPDDAGWMQSASAAVEACEHGDVDGAARIIFGPGLGGGKAAAAWRKQRRMRMKMRRRMKKQRRD